MAQPPATSLPDVAAAERDALVATKFHVPRAGFLPRPRLLARLARGMARGLTVVCTPAGFGKTTLLGDWARRSRRPVAWLSLDEADNDPARFWRYLAAALDQLRPGVGAQVGALLHGAEQPPLEAAATAVINELSRPGHGEVALVLDDYHLIQAPAVHDSVAFLLDRLPPGLRLLLASRADPPLPLARLRARGQLAELRERDLRFTLEETAAFLGEATGVELPVASVAALQDRTEGWAAGVQLAALSLQGHTDPARFVEAFSGSHRYVLDYLTEEVLARQPEQVVRFLLETSVLDRLSGPLCDVVCGRTGSQRLLEQVERASLFLHPLDDVRGWWRYHHLFADLLRARLQQTEAGRVPELHRRAAEWCEQHGLIDEAIHHALGSGDGTWAARLVEQHLGETLGRDESVLLERWLSRLPDEAVRSRPALCLAEGLRQLFLGRLDSVERLLEQAELAFDHGQGPREFGVLTEVGMVAEVPAAIALLRAELAGTRGDPEAMVGYARSALAEMGENEQGPRFWARWLAGAEAERMRGRLAEAESAAAELLAEGRAAPDPHPGMVSSFPLGQLQQERGRLTAALQTYREALRLATEGARTSAYQAGLAHLGIAQVLYERNQLEDALQHVTEASALGRQERWFREHERVSSAWIHQALGEPDSARAAMNEACRLQASPEVSSLWYPAPSERARLLLAQGQPREAERWTDERGLTENDEVSYVRERDHLVLARVLLAQRQPEQALGLLQRLHAQAMTQGRTGSLLELQALQALALDATGGRAAALAALAEALALACPEGYVRVFVDEGAPMASLLHRLAAAHRTGRAPLPGTVRPGDLDRLLQAFQLGAPRAGPHPKRDHATGPGPGELLSDRELQVLGLLAAGKSNPEIAEELVVALDTVKKHVGHILDKLGAANRTQAVARARVLGLLR
jgi:LuxR family transcriptional regulator, maltose regulon positive regulatory protein